MPPTLVTSMLVLVMICKAVHNLGTLIVNVQPWFVFRRILMHFYVTDQLLSVCLSVCLMVLYLLVLLL